MASSVDELWSQLVAAALVGAERKPLSGGVAGGVATLDGVLARVDNSDAEKSLLHAATAVTAYRHAGVQAHNSAATLPPPTAPEALPYCDQATANTLADLVGRADFALVGEWLRLAQQHKRLVRPEQLSQLLGFAMHHAQLQSLLPPVIGKRGEWLIAQNSEWGYARTDLQAVSADFETASGAARKNLLAQIRAQDPALARQLVEKTWAEEKANSRKDMVEALVPGLSMEDEPFLEMALDDRSKDVRRAAADTLVRLRDSRLVARMIRRATPLLNYVPAKRGLLGALTGAKGELQVTLPEANTPEMQRDSITDPLAHQGMGEKAWLLKQHLSAIPPDLWTTRFGATPQELLAAAKKTEWKDAFVYGWIDAAGRFGDPDWAEALLDDEVREQLYYYTVINLINALPQERWENMILQRIRADQKALAKNSATLNNLSQRSGVWSSTFSRAIVQNLQWIAAHDYKDAVFSLRYLLDQFARSMAADVCAEATQNWPTNAPGWEMWAEVFPSFITTLERRARMHNEWTEV